MVKGFIFFTEQNIHGAYVIYGELGVKQYYGYTKKESEQMYKEECKSKLVYNEKGWCSV